MGRGEVGWGGMGSGYRGTDRDKDGQRNKAKHYGLCSFGRETKYSFQSLVVFDSLSYTLFMDKMGQFQSDNPFYENSQEYFLVAFAIYHSI